MKKSVLFMLLALTSSATNALVITLEVSNTTIHMSENASFNEVVNAVPNTYLLEYEVADEIWFTWQVQGGISYSEQVGESQIYNSNIEFISRTAAPSSGLFQDFINANYSYQANADFRFDDNYTDVRLDYWAHELYPQFANDADKQKFNGTVDSAIRVSTNEEQGWANDVGGMQVGQTYEWWTRFDLDTLFDELPATQFGTYDDFTIALQHAMANDVTFGYHEQLHIFDFERSEGNTSAHISFNDRTEENTMLLDATARIVGLDGITTIQVSEPSTLVILAFGALSLLRVRRK